MRHDSAHSEDYSVYYSSAMTSVMVANGSITNNLVFYYPGYDTDPSNPNTDADGLTDYEELFVYNTNPLNPHSVCDTYCDGIAVKIGDINPFSYPEGSTNTVLEHVFYSGTTNGAFAYPQSSDSMAVLEVSVSGSGLTCTWRGNGNVEVENNPPRAATITYKSYRLRLMDANGASFSRTERSGDVNLAGVCPSSAVGDATLAFSRNGEIYLYTLEPPRF